MSNDHRTSHADIAALAVALLVFGALAVVSIRDGGPLGHDEAVYSLRAAWAGGDHSVNLGGYWLPYRAPGLPWVLSLLWAARSTEPFLRIGVALFGAAGVALTWFLARDLFGRRAAGLAAMGMAVSPWWLLPSVRVWPDVPGATLGLATLTVLVWASRGERISWWAVAAAPMAVLTTIVRFGAPLSLVAGALFILWWRWDLVRTSLPVVVTTGALAVGGAWLVLFSTLVSGGTESPFDAIAALKTATGQSVFEGFRGYWQMSGDQLATPVAGALVAGVAGAALYWAASERRRALVFVSGTAAATFLILAGTLHAELRYLSPVVPFLLMFAGYGLAELSRQWSLRVLVTVGLVAMIPFVLGTQKMAAEESEILKHRFSVLKTAMETTDWPEDCRIATSFAPQVGWYSGCRVVGLDRDGEPVPDGVRPSHIVDVFGSEKEPDSLDDWLLKNAFKETVFGDPSQGAMQSVSIFVPQ